MNKDGTFNVNFKFHIHFKETHRVTQVKSCLINSCVLIKVHGVKLSYMMLGNRDVTARQMDRTY